MEKKLLSVFIAITLCLVLKAQNNIGIGVTNPHPSSVLEMQSADKGILVPRLSSLQRIAIPSPANGLMVFDTDSSCFFFFRGATNQWISLCNAGPAGATGAQGQQGIQGATGATGVTGATGSQGLQGIQGVTGATGATGAQGLQGIPGITGETGATGSQGQQGIQGVTGATGATGAQGLQGIQGITGATGPLGAAGGDLSGVYPNPTVSGLQNRPVAATAPATNDVLYWNGTNWTPSNGNDLFWRITGNSGTNANNHFVGTSDAVGLTFRTSNVERARISAIGNFRIGGLTYPTIAPNSADAANTTLSATGGFSAFGGYNNDPFVNAAAPGSTWIGGVGTLVVGINRTAGTSGVDFWNTTSHNQSAATGNTDRGFYFRRFNNAGAEQLLGRIEGDGRFYGTSFTNVSDERAKRGFENFPSVIERIKQVKAYRYLLIDQSQAAKGELQFSDVATQRDFGFIAQELYKLFPEVVHKPADERKELWGIDYAKFSVILLKAVQEQQHRIEELEKQLKK